MSCVTIFFYKQVQISRSDIGPHILVGCQPGDFCAQVANTYVLGIIDGTYVGMCEDWYYIDILYYCIFDVNDQFLVWIHTINT